MPLGKLRLACLLTLAAAANHCGTLYAQSDASYSEVEDKTDRWIELEARIATASSEWQIEKAMLENNIKLLETERETLKKNIESNQKASEVYVSNRDRLKQGVGEKKEALASLELPVDEIERSLRQLMVRLPPPLHKQVSTQLARLEPNEEGIEASQATRIQSVIAALDTIERFSNSLHLSRELKEGGATGEVSAKVLYWGMAIGYALDAANQRAWLVEPIGTGWKWTEVPEEFETVQSLINSYENEVEDPQLLFLPATLH